MLANPYSQSYWHVCRVLGLASQNKTSLDITRICQFWQINKMHTNITLLKTHHAQYGTNNLFVVFCCRFFNFFFRNAIKQKTKHLIQTSPIEWPYSNCNLNFIRCHVYGLLFSFGVYFSGYLLGTNSLQMLNINSLFFDHKQKKLIDFSDFHTRQKSAKTA